MSFHCPECKKADIELAPDSRSTIECPTCHRSFDVVVFSDSSSAPACHPIPRTSDTETACFHHSNNRAEGICDVCGRLICSLCTFEFADAVICSSCISSRRNGRPLLPLEHRRILYDGLALRLTLWPMVFISPLLFTAPLAIFTAIWNWKKPSSIVPRTKLRAVAAILIATFQIGLIATMIVSVFLALSSTHD